LIPLDQCRRGDRRRKEIVRLNDRLEGGMHVIPAPILCLHNAFPLLQLLKEEYTVNSIIPRIYYNALQIMIASKDQARAKVFAGKVCAARIVLEGEDGPEIKRLVAFVEPANHRLFKTSMKWKQ
jgi:hypothetical protein